MLGLLVCLSFAFRRASCRDGALDCWDVVGRGVGGFVGVCFGSGRSILGLHIIYVMNVISLIFLG